jgi:Lipase maturation factor
LNLITMVLAISTLDSRFLAHLIPLPAPLLHEPALGWRVTIWILAGAVVWLSIRPVRNLLSAGQLMNYSYNPFHLVGTYGAFGGVTRLRHEIVMEGTAGNIALPGTALKEYEFKGKPGNTSRRPPQIAPYHLRLDWLMWLAAMRPYDVPVWFLRLVAKLFDGDRRILRLLKTNPFPETPPQHIRALFYEYRFTSPEEKRGTGQWWHRILIAVYLPPGLL